MLYFYFFVLLFFSTSSSILSIKLYLFCHFFLFSRIFLCSEWCSFSFCFLIFFIFFYIICLYFMDGIFSFNSLRIPWRGSFKSLSKKVRFWLPTIEEPSEGRNLRISAFFRWSVNPPPSVKYLHVPEWLVKSSHLLWLPPPSSVCEAPQTANLQDF